MVKNLPASAGDMGSIPGSERPPWRRKWEPTPVFLPGKSHGQRSLAGCSPWGCKGLGINSNNNIPFKAPLKIKKESEQKLAASK